MCLLHQIFHGHRILQHFYNLTIFESINLAYEDGKYNLVPYSFGSGIEEQIPVFQGQIQVLVLALTKILFLESMGFVHVGLLTILHSPYS